MHGTFSAIAEPLVTPRPIGERSIVTSVSVCLCMPVIISSELDVQCLPKFFCMLPMAVALSFPGGIVICYVTLRYVFLVFMDDVILAHKLRLLFIAARLR